MMTIGAMAWLLLMVVVTCIAIALAIVGMVWLALELEHNYLRRTWVRMHPVKPGVR